MWGFNRLKPVVSLNRNDLHRSKSTLTIQLYYTFFPEAGAVGSRLPEFIPRTQRMDGLCELRQKC